jgi:hypothetical protein
VRLAGVVSGCTLDATAAKTSKPHPVSLPESLTELSTVESSPVVVELVVLLTEELRFISCVGLDSPGLQRVALCAFSLVTSW